jgi:hypothetical protein
MATRLVKKGSIYSTVVVFKTKTNLISIECAVGYHNYKTTIQYQTPSLFRFITSFQSEGH